MVQLSASLMIAITCVVMIIVLIVVFLRNGKSQKRKSAKKKKVNKVVVGAPKKAVVVKEQQASKEAIPKKNKPKKKKVKNPEIVPASPAPVIESVEEEPVIDLYVYNSDDSDWLEDAGQRRRREREARPKPVAKPVEKKPVKKERFRRKWDYSAEEIASIYGPFPLELVTKVPEPEEEEMEFYSSNHAPEAFNDKHVFSRDNRFLIDPLVENVNPVLRDRDQLEAFELPRWNPMGLPAPKRNESFKVVHVSGSASLSASHVLEIYKALRRDKERNTIKQKNQPPKTVTARPQGTKVVSTAQ